jgi:hypothetical protein
MKYEVWGTAKDKETGIEYPIGLVTEAPTSTVAIQYFEEHYSQYGTIYDIEHRIFAPQYEFNLYRSALAVMKQEASK